MKRFFGFLLMLLTVVAVSAKDIKTVILTTNPELECGKCENKVKENLRFVRSRWRRLATRRASLPRRR